MSRSPSVPAADPGDSLLLLQSTSSSVSSSITLDPTGVHEQAMQSVPYVSVSSFPNRRNQMEEGERIRIPIRPEDVHYYQSQPSVYSLARRLKALLFPYSAGGEGAKGEKGCSASGALGCGGNTSVSDPVGKAARFDRALWALESMSASVCIEAAADRDARVVVEEVLAKLAEQGFLGGDEDGERGEMPAEEAQEEFVLVNLYECLDAEGKGYIEMVADVPAYDEGDQRELAMAVLHCGSRF